MTDRLIERSLRAFSEDLASDSAVPGGGSTAAYAGALGAALASMVGRIAERKDKGQATATFIAEAENLRADFLRLVDDDSAAYARVAEAMTLPKVTDDEKRARKERMQSALLAASRVPLEIAKTGRRLLDACERGLRQRPHPATAISSTAVRRAGNHDNTSSAHAAHLPAHSHT